MKLEELHELWDKEQKLDLSQPDQIIRDTPLAHARWWRYYTDEKKTHLLVKQEYDKLKLLKTEWLNGRMDDATRIGLKWDIQPLKLIKNDIEDYLAADPELSVQLGKVEMQLLKLKFIEDCIKSINNRGFMIKNYIDWLRFSNGS